MVTVALSSSKILAEGKILAAGPQDDNKNTDQANILVVYPLKYFKNTLSFI